MKVLKGIDFLGQEPQTYVFKMPRYKTYIGGAFSLVTLVVIIAFSIYFSFQVFARTQLNLISGQTSNFKKQIDLNDVPFLSLLASPTGVTYNTSVIYPIIQIWNYYPEYHGVANITTIPFKQCEASDVKSYKKLFNSSHNLSSYLCLDKTGVNLTIWGFNGDTNAGYSRLSIWPAKCTNGSEYNPNANKNDCFSSASIDEILANNPPHLYMIYPDNIIDFDSATQPVKPYLRTEDFNFPLGAANRYIYQFKVTSVKSDLGFVFDEYVHFETFQFDSVKTSSAGFTIKEAFGNVSYYLATKADIHKRTYVKLQVLVANIGGIVNFVYIIANLIVTYVTNKSLMLDYVNSRLCNQEKEGGADNQSSSSNLRMVGIGKDLIQLTNLKRK
jgi:hypothetical protein